MQSKEPSKPSKLAQQTERTRTIGFSAKLEFASDEDEALLLELMAQLNKQNRRLQTLAASCGLVEKGIVPRLEAADARLTLPHGSFFTSHQESMLARKASADMKTWKANLEAQVERKGELLSRTLSSIEALEAAIKSGLAAAKAGFAKSEAAERQEAELRRLQSKRDALTGEIDEAKLRIEHGAYGHVFGGRKLLSQRAFAGTSQKGFAPAHASLDDWRRDWSQARDGSWMFEGSRHAFGANKNIKPGNGLMPESEGKSNELGCNLSKKDMAQKHQALGAKADGKTIAKPFKLSIRIRLGEFQARHRLKRIASEAGVPYAAALDTANKQYSTLRTESEWIEVGLSTPKTKSQRKRLERLVAAYERGADGSCSSPISWLLMAEGNDLYANASWSIPAPIACSKANGVLGVDVNGRSLEWALCKKDGSSHPLARKSEWCGSIPLDLEGLSTNQALARIREAAKGIASRASRLGVPVALEALEFSRLKSELRSLGPERARQLSSFAYSAILQEIERECVACGSFVLWVDPAWTSISGFAKFSARLGLSIDKAAAFAIARKGALSRKRQCRLAKVPGQNGKAWTASRHEMPDASLGFLWKSNPSKGSKSTRKQNDKTQAQSKTKGDSKETDEAKLTTPNLAGHGPSTMRAAAMTRSDAYGAWRTAKGMLGKDRRQWARLLAIHIRSSRQARSTLPTPTGEPAQQAGGLPGAQGRHPTPVRGWSLK